MLDRLWNGWRAAYVGGVGDARAAAAVESGAQPVSVFTALLQSGLPDTETHIVRRGTSCFAIMNAFPYVSGHLMVLPYREVADLEALSDAERSELWAMVTQAVATLKAVYRPDGVNVGINLGVAAGGSVSAHLHVHAVPRWVGDCNFMTAIAEARTLPEALSVSAARLRDGWVASPAAGDPSDETTSVG